MALLLRVIQSRRGIDLALGHSNQTFVGAASWAAGSRPDAMADNQVVPGRPHKEVLTDPHIQGLRQTREARCFC